MKLCKIKLKNCRKSLFETPPKLHELTGQNYAKLRENYAIFRPILTGTPGEINREIPKTPRKLAGSSPETPRKLSRKSAGNGYKSSEPRREKGVRHSTIPYRKAEKRRKRYETVRNYKDRMSIRGTPRTRQCSSASPRTVTGGNCGLTGDSRIQSSPATNSIRFSVALSSS